MTDERRYSDDEIAEIFEDAAAPDHRRPRPPGAGHGLTLAELQAIGREVGIAPERITAAATALERRSMSSRRTSFALPISITRTVDLPRMPTDHEWAVLLGELRETFRAPGKEVSHGDIRGWVNGNLHAYIEPSETGIRLRMGTLKGDAVAINRLGGAALLFAAVLFTILLLSGELPNEFMIPVLLAIMGLGAFTFNGLTLPAWAREREEQMAYVAQRAQALIGPET